MVSSLHKKWSCISRLYLVHLYLLKIFFLIDIEFCLLRVQVISTDNYPLNVNLFKLFSPNGKLECRVPHPLDENMFLFLTFDFVHLLKSIRNNWIHQKDFEKSFLFPTTLTFQKYSYTPYFPCK